MPSGMTEVISRHREVVQHFVGDEVCVAFGSSPNLRDSVDHAVRAPFGGRTAVLLYASVLPEGRRFARCR